MSKKVLKNEVKLNLEFTQEQREAFELIDNHPITILYGKAGTSKSLTAVAAAYKLFTRKEIKKIYITRPAVAIEKLGYLKGGLEEKLDPYLIPIKQNLYKIYNKVAIDKMFLEGDIEILPIAFIQGVTIDDLIIVDEAENLTEYQIKILISRIGLHGKMILTGDTNQSAIVSNGFQRLLDLDMKSITKKEMKINYRHSLVEEFLTKY